MAHYAFLDENNIVTEIIVGKNEGEDGIDWEQWYGEFRGQKCVQTSYNNNIRKHFAGIGYRYDPVADVFIEPKPFDSWILNADNEWESLIPRPDLKHYWDDLLGTWVRHEAIYNEVSELTEETEQ